MPTGRRLLLALALGALAISGCGSTPGDQITRYCQYGAVSLAQLDGCIDHVDQHDIDSRNTNPARWARGQLDRCLPDAGPFCRD